MNSKGERTAEQRSPGRTNFGFLSKGEGEGRDGVGLRKRVGAAAHHHIIHWKFKTSLKQEARSDGAL